MSNPQIDPLNRLLRDYLGASPSGAGMYKWIHSRDRELFCWIGRLMSGDTKASYEHVPQVQEVRWVLAKWMYPPHERMWEMQFHGQVAYPRGGYYAAVSIPSDPLLVRGVEPNERITMYAIGLRKKQIELGEFGIMQAFADRREYNDRQKENGIDDALTDRWSNFNPVVHGASAEHFA